MKDSKLFNADALTSSVPKVFGDSPSSEEKHTPLYRAVLLMTLARASNSDANIHHLEIETIQQIMQRESGQEVTEADIRKATRPDLYESVNLRKYLRSVRRQLKASDRITIMQALADVIKSDTQINVLEIDFFDRVADALRITRAELPELTA